MTLLRTFLLGAFCSLSAIQLSAQNLIENLGGGTSGANGIPAMALSGSMLFETPLMISLANTPPLSLAVVVVGTSIVNLPLAGGLLVPSPDVTLTMVADQSGVGSLTVPTPDFENYLFFQCVVLDPIASGGMALSNAMAALAGIGAYAADKYVASGGEQVLICNVRGTAASSYQVFVTSGTPPVRRELVGPTALQTPTGQDFAIFLPRACLQDESIEVVGETTGRRSKPYDADLRAR